MYNAVGAVKSEAQRLISRKEEGIYRMKRDIT